jgi:hypothetical protein
LLDETGILASATLNSTTGSILNQIEQLGRSKVKSKHRVQRPNRYRYVRIPGKAEWRRRLIDRA